MTDVKFVQDQIQKTLNSLHKKAQDKFIKSMKPMEERVKEMESQLSKLQSENQQSNKSRVIDQLRQMAADNQSFFKDKIAEIQEWIRHIEDTPVADSVELKMQWLEGMVQEVKMTVANDHAVSHSEFDMSQTQRVDDLETKVEKAVEVLTKHGGELTSIWDQVSSFGDTDHAKKEHVLSLYEKFKDLESQVEERITQENSQLIKTMSQVNENLKTKLASEI